MASWCQRICPANAAERNPIPADRRTVAFPGVASRTGSQAVGAGNISDFDPQTWKAVASTIGAVNLNRKLADYRVDPTQPFPGVPTNNNVTAASAQLAINDRQQFATDIFNRFCVACGAQLNASGPAYNSAQYNALRYLAQLSVNLVDYIDNDDYMTPFNWNAAYVGQNGIVADTLCRYGIASAGDQRGSSSGRIAANGGRQDQQCQHDGSHAVCRENLGGTP